MQKGICKIQMKAIALILGAKLYRVSFLLRNVSIVDLLPTGTGSTMGLFLCVGITTLRGKYVT